MTDSAEEMFDQAASGDLFKYNDHLGELVVIWPLDFEEDFPTVNGPSDIIKGNVLVVDGEHAGEFYENAFLFGMVIYSSLKPKIGRQVLGRIGQGAKQPGKSAAWIIVPFVDGEPEQALDAVRAWKAGEFEAPAETGTPPAATKPAAKPAAKPRTAAAAKKEPALTDQQLALATTLINGNTPPEMVVAATGATLTQLADAGLIELQ